MKNKKLLAVLSVIFALSLLAGVFVACGETAKTYSVTFNAQNGTAAQTLAFDDGFALPADPTREGYVFGGWYTDAACTAGNEWSVPSSLSKDITVYAKWTEVVYTVTFNFQNGTDSLTVDFDENFNLPAEPTKGGYNFSGWYTNKACSDGLEWTVPSELTQNINVYAKWVEHEHDFGGNYLMFVQCQIEGCNVLGREDSDYSAREDFVYNFNDEKAEEINADYQALLDNLGVIEESAYEDLFYVYDDDLSYIVEQYQYANVFYHVYNDDDSTADFQTIEAFYNEHVSKYYGLFRKVYESSYRDEFFAGWTEDEIKQILAMSDKYGNEQYVAISDQIDTVLHEYDDLTDNKASTTQITAKYKELVELNNQLAVLSGYANYMEYAYDVVYERAYTPEETTEMRNYVKTYLVPLVQTLCDEYVSSYPAMTSKGLNFYNAFNASVFGKKTVSNSTVCEFMGNYLKQMTYSGGAKEIDYFKYANELFKNGNYYLGEQEGAFTYWIPAQQKSILYFSNTGSYQGAFTFVHEFGHYYNGIYNEGLSLSMDHDETQSQGDEMLFLAWLSQNIAKDQRTGFNTLRYEQLVNMFYIINIATAVDEFEYAVYTDNYEGKSVKDNYSDYSVLFRKIAASYKIEAIYSLFFDSSDYQDHWSLVVFHSAGYYISYAMSALPSVEIYVKAMEDFEGAKVSYFKLYTFADDTTGTYVEVETDDEGNVSKSVVATYNEILHYCGLQGPFEEGLYTLIADYLGE